MDVILDELVGYFVKKPIRHNFDATAGNSTKPSREYDLVGRTIRQRFSNGSTATTFLGDYKGIFRGIDTEGNPCKVLLDMKDYMFREHDVKRMTDKQIAVAKNEMTNLVGLEYEVEPWDSVVYS